MMAWRKALNVLSWFRLSEAKHEARQEANRLAGSLRASAFGDGKAVPAAVEVTAEDQIAAELIDTFLSRLGAMLKKLRC
jgi:hypothetical protein